jgi:AraC family transcriptional regulator
MLDAHIIERSAFRLIGYSARVPVVQQSRNPHIEAHIAALPAESLERLRTLGRLEPSGLLQVSADVDPDYAVNSRFTFMVGVAFDAGSAAPEGLDVIDVPMGTWAVFLTGASFASAWMDVVSEWFPSNPWLLRPGPSIVTERRSGEHRTATAEVWIPVEHA